MSYHSGASDFTDTQITQAISSRTRIDTSDTTDQRPSKRNDRQLRMPSNSRTPLIPLAQFHWLPLVLVLIASVIGQYATLVQTAPVPIYPDSLSYLVVTKAILTHGNVFDLFRTPGYPAFLALIALVTGNDSLQNVTVAQAAVMVIVSFEVYALVFNITHLRWIATIAAIVCGTNLYFLDWERTMLSEALAPWACVTVFLLLERYLSTGRRAWLAGLCFLLFIAIMIRPMYIELPIVIVVILLFRALLRGEIKRTWQELGFALGVPYLLVVGYMVGNRIVNGYFTLSYVSNVNLLGKIMDYKLQNDNGNPRFAQLQADLNTYMVQHPDRMDPWVFLKAYPQYDHVPYTEAGQFSVGIVEHHLLGFIMHTPHDLIAAWHAYPLLFAQWNVTTGWIGGLEAVSSIVLRSYTFLPVLLLLLALLFWRTKGALAPFMLFTLLICVVADMYMGGVGSYIDAYRLRAPFDWAIAVVTVIALCQAGVWAARGIPVGAARDTRDEQPH